MNPSQTLQVPAVNWDAPTRPATSSGIDAIKALAIVLVVLRHTQLSGFARKLIYLFHVPAFFFASGLVARPLGRGYVSARQVKRLLAVFGIFTVLGTVVTRVKQEVLGREIVSLVAQLRDSFLWGNIQHLEHYGQVLWFIPSLVGSLAVLEFARRRGSKPLAIAIASIAWLGCLALTGFLNVSTIPYSLNTLAVAILFVALGYHADMLRRVPRSLVALIMGCLAYGALLMHGYTNNIFSLIYPNPLFIATASLGTWVGVLWLLITMGVRDLGPLKIYSDEA